MKFSIVTISFNQAKFLEQAICSVLEQDYPQVEYIVVDPGSTDGSRDIIERYRHRISKVILQPDRGAAEGLNNGFSEATGDIYGYLNSDDLLLPDALTRVAKYFQPDPNVNLVTGHTRIIDQNGKWIRNSYSDRFNKTAFAYSACVICQPSSFFRATIFQGTKGFNVNNNIGWDAELFWELFRAPGGYVQTDEFFSAFRIHGEAITGGAKMTEELRAYRLTQFQLVKGRPWRKFDHAIRLILLVRKYVLEPRSLLHRVLYGSIYGRYKKVKRKSPGNLAERT